MQLHAPQQSERALGAPVGSGSVSIKAVLGALGQGDPDLRVPDATPALVFQKRGTDSAAETEGLLGSTEGWW